MSDRILVFYGSYRENRAGIRLADFLVRRLAARGATPVLIDARVVGLPMLDKRYSDYAPGTAPANLEMLAEQIRTADAFVFVAGEYNGGMQPGLKNLTDHFLAEWRRRPAGIVSYSAGRFGGARSNAAWHAPLTAMGMAVIPSLLAVASINQTLTPEGEPAGEGGAALERGFVGFADELAWWTAAVRAQRERTAD